MTAAAPGRMWLEAGVVALLVTALYASGACPTIYVGDSGELVTAAATLGIPHPPGYPLYVLLGHLWLRVIPLGEVAWRMSLFSAVCGGAACGVLYAVLRREPVPALAALTGAGLLAVAPSVWGEANVQRVYALNALFLMAAFLAAQSWCRRPTNRRLARLFFVCAVGAGNHLFLGLVGLVAIPWALWVHPAVRHPRHWVRAGMLSVLGLGVYLYLPIRSQMDPVLDWGDPETPARFADVVLRRDFWERAYLEQWSDLGDIVADWAMSLGRECTWGGVGLAALGVATAWRSRLPALGLLVLLANLTTMAFHGSRSDLFIWHRYYIPSYAVVALLAGLGAGALVPRLPRAARVLPVLLPAWMLVAGYRSFDRSRYAIAEAFSATVLRGLPPGATLIATDDNVLFVLIYLHHALGIRPDVALVMQGVGGMTPPPLRFDPTRDPVFFTHHPNWQIAGLTIEPRGLVFQAWRAGAPISPPFVPLDVLPGEHDPRVPKDYLTRNVIGHFHYMLGLTFEGRDWPRARREFRAAAAAAPDNDVLFYNLGLIYARAGLLDEARAAFLRAHAINPRHLATGSRPRASDRLAEIEREQARVAALERELLAVVPALTRLAPDSVELHEALAARLATRGEGPAAEGHRRRALEIRAELDARAAPS